MDRIPSLSLTGLSLSHHPLSSLQSQNLSTSTNSSSSAALNQQALNSLNFHQQSNHNHHTTQLNQNLNHSIITSSNSVVPHHQHHQQQHQQQQSQLHSTNLHHHHQQHLNGLLNNVGAANGWVSAKCTSNEKFSFVLMRKLNFEHPSIYVIFSSSLKKFFDSV